MCDELMDTGGELNVAMRSSSVDFCAESDSCYIPHNMRWANVSSGERRPVGSLSRDPTLSTTGKPLGQGTR